MEFTTRNPHPRRAITVVWLLCACALAAGLAFSPRAIAGTPSGGSCGQIDFAPQSDNIAFDIKSSGVSCSAARAVAGASRPNSLRPGAKHSYDAAGFVCRGRFVQPRGKDYEHYVCARGGDRVVFDRG